MLGAQLGPFRVEEELGAGGMGKVFRAEVLRDAEGCQAGDHVALKVIHPHLLEGEGFFKRFLREAEIGRAVQHENVVRTYDCDQLLVDGVLHSFLIMEYVEGQTLRSLVGELGTVPEELCRHIGREIAGGLTAIHGAGAVHRDLKPENVLITPAHEVKVMDLGVARLQDEVIRLSQTGQFAGSILYAAPEAFRGSSTDVDGRADLYSLGVLLYELSTSVHPYARDDVKGVLDRLLNQEPRRAGEVNPQLSPFFEEVVHTLIAKDPGERFPTAADLLLVLEEGETGAWWQARAKALREATARPLRRIRIPRETALYGRDDELARLDALYEQVQEGEGQVVLIEGEAGIGKTRLVDEFVAALARAGAEVNFLFGSYPPGGAATAAGAFATAYREHFGAEGLETALSAYLDTTPTLVPAFAALLRGEPPPADHPAFTKESLQTVFVNATRALAGEHPTIILVDDLHFAPSEGRSLFASLALAVPGHRVLLIGTTRRRGPDAWVVGMERLEHATRMLIERLGPKDLVRLLEDAFHSERLAAQLAGRIAVKSDGNPFFAFEIIRGMRDGQIITQQPDGKWSTPQRIEDIQVPSSVLDLVNARVADLSSQERELLDLASCCGFDFDPVPLCDITGLSRIALLKMLGQIERRHRLVRAAGRRFAFDHHQVQEALYEGLSELLREEYHAALGNALEARSGAGEKDPADLDGELCVELSEHHLKGAQGKRALRYLEPALAHLEGGYVNDQAIQLMSRALEAPGLLTGETRADLLLRKAVRLDHLGYRKAQAEAIDEAYALAEAEGHRRHLAAAERARGRHCHETGRPVEAQAHYERALTLFRDLSNTAGEAHTLGQLGALLRSLGRYEEAAAHHAHHRALAEEMGDQRGVAAATGSLALVLLNQGRNAEALEHFQQHLSLSRAIGDAPGVARAIGNTGLVLRALGRYEEARAHFEERLSLARHAGDRRGESLAVGNLGLVYLDLGRIEDARRFHEHHRVLAREIGDREGEVRAVGNLGLVLHALGRFDEAREQHEQHRALCIELGDREGEARAIGNAGYALAAMGHLGKARDHHEQHLALAREIGHGEGEVLAAGNLGLALLSLGRTKAAEETLHEAVALARRIENPRAEGLWLNALGEVALNARELRQARDRYSEGFAVYERVGLETGMAASHVRLARIAGLQGETERLREHASEAVRLAREAGDTTVLAFGRVELALLPNGDLADGRAAFEEATLEHEVRLELSFRLWQATGDEALLVEAKRALDHALEQAPEEDRAAMCTKVTLNREVLDAWAARSAG